MNLVNSINSLPNIKFLRWIPKEHDLLMLIVFGPKHSEFCVWDVIKQTGIVRIFQEEIIDIAFDNDKSFHFVHSIAVSTIDDKITIFHITFILGSEFKLDLKQEFEKMHNQKIVVLEKNLLFTCGKRKRSSLLARSFRYKIFDLKVIF